MEYTQSSQGNIMIQSFNAFWYINSILSFAMGMVTYQYTYYWSLVCLAVGFICLSIPALSKLLRQKSFVNKVKKDGFM